MQVVRCLRFAYFCLVYMVVITLVGAANDHDGEVFAGVHTEVVNRRLQEMAVLSKPLREVQGRCKRHSDVVQQEFGLERRVLETR